MSPFQGNTTSVLEGSLVKQENIVKGGEGFKGGISFKSYKA